MRDLLDRLGCVGLKVLRGFTLRLSLESSLSLGRFFGRMLLGMTPRKGNVLADLKAALGPDLSADDRRKIYRKMSEHFGMMFVETLRGSSFDKQEMQKFVTFHHKERLTPYYEEKRPLIFLTAHLGNWELLQFTSNNLGRPIHVLAQPQKFPRMDQYLNYLRELRGGTKAVDQGIGVRHLFRALKKGEMIGLLGDRSAGKTEGLIVSFLGRKTTIPTGAFELARRTGVPILPVFFPRREGHYFDYCVEEEIRVSDDLEAAVQKYVLLLEKYVRQYPEQWLWFGKRWKYSWTKRLLVLSDGKPGHRKQSEALVQHFRKVTTQYNRPGMDYPSQTLTVKYRSRFHEALFPWVVFFMMPLAQGHVHWLRPFFCEETFQEILKVSADFIISAGSKLAPLNLFLARDLRAKSVVLMKPSFPFHLFRYDLAVIPAHDHGWIPRESIRPVLALNPVDAASLEIDAKKLMPSLRQSSQSAKLAIFLGGPTRNFSMSLSQVQILFQELELAAPLTGGFMVTTSRRTPDDILQFLEKSLLNHPYCQLFVDAKRDTRPEVAGGMMGIADILLVTEDSISMISEAISAQKKVIVITFDTENLPKKHQRFQSLLEERSAIWRVRPQDLGAALGKIIYSDASVFSLSEETMVQKKLQEIL